MTDIPRLVIAGTMSGVGKTLIAAGLTRALVRQGLRVATFKAGPDFIDPSFLTVAAGRPSHNLDSWMIPRPALLEIFGSATRHADVAIVEGMMGLFDGRGPISDDGSTAQLARVLRAPVTLVLDAGRASRSVAALVSGYRRFDRRLSFAGVIANQLASERHAAWVTQAISSLAGTPVLAALQRDASLTLGSRHLGLVQASDMTDAESTINAMADRLESVGGVTPLLAAARGAPPLTIRQHAPRSLGPSVRIAVARDPAFTFYYQANLDRLTEAGAELAFFSPLADRAVPEGVAGIYLGGGYPELHAAQLAANQSMLASIRNCARRDMPIYAECGGLLYLSRTLRDLEGHSHHLAGVLEQDARMERKRVALGYAEVEALDASFLLQPGQRARGHEFHWSRVEAADARSQPLYRVTSSSDTRVDGVRVGSVVASYVHLHFASQPGLTRRWLAACRRWRKMAMIVAHP